MQIYGLLIQAGIGNMLIDKEIKYVIYTMETPLSWLCNACFPGFLLCLQVQAQRTFIKRGCLKSIIVANSQDYK
jgi:hypothetical protein